MPCFFYRNEFNAVRSGGDAEEGSHTSVPKKCHSWLDAWFQRDARRQRLGSPDCYQLADSGFAGEESLLAW